MAHWKTVALLGGLLAFSSSSRAQEAPKPAPPAQAKPSSADDNPFPEAQSEAAQKDANVSNGSASDGPAAPTDGGESSSRTPATTVDVPHDGGAHAGAKVVENAELAKEDVRVGQLYMADSNYVGAYARFKEATEVGPGNAEAVFYLAEAARKTAHLDEAAANYKLYLDADPKGKHGKEAKKALAELAGK